MHEPVETHERRADYIVLHERVATLEQIAKDTRDDVRELSGYLRAELPVLDNRVKELEGVRRWLAGIAIASSVIGGAIAWIWEHILRQKP